MTAPLYLLEPAALAGVAVGSLLVLDGDEGHHAATVRRTRPGETLLVASGEGLLARGVVEDVAARSVRLRVEAVANVEVPAPRLVLVQALAKGGRDELAIETATELGVDAVVPWQAARSVVVWSGERGERSRRRWGTTVRAAAKQSRRAIVPQVRPTVTTAQLAASAGATAAVLVLHEDAPTPLTAVPLPEAGSDGEVLVVVGPEGGITEAELEQLAAAGGVAVRLGPTVLRSSSAGPAALAVLSARLRRW
ncbi:MAG TPA: 16S rRNA (uracil(1498)-N(3))-methyltransferase [Kineosporiaceae bacterium]|nr:16S rRNA (uracil(1498)-N(3))-methyltransferase [Kineosporiaceae bacterium]